jgi:hypothetical protein
VIFSININFDKIKGYSRTNKNKRIEIKLENHKKVLWMLYKKPILLSIENPQNQ